MGKAGAFLRHKTRKKKLVRCGRQGPARGRRRFKDIHVKITETSAMYGNW